MQKTDLKIFFIVTTKESLAGTSPANDADFSVVFINITGATVFKSVSYQLRVLRG